MDELIKALMILKEYLKSYNTKFPTHCEHDVLYVCDVQLENMPVEVVHELFNLGFIPGAEDDYSYIEDVDFNEISEQEWNDLKTKITDCFYSYRYGSC